MKIEITINSLTPERIRLLVVAALVGTSVLILTQLGFASWLLFLAFCLLILAIFLLWSSVTTVGEDQNISLQDALDLAAPARDEERKLAVLRGIKDLEYERGLGKVSEQDYEQLTQRYRREAKRLLERLDTSEASVRQKAIDLADAMLSKTASSSDAIASDTRDPKRLEPSETTSAETPKDVDG